MSNKTIVRFTKAWRSWFAGDVAGFDKDTAEALIGGGVATSYSSITAVSAQVAKDSQPASQPKGGKDKHPPKRGVPVKSEPVTSSGSSSLLDTSSIASSGTGSESYDDHDDTRNSADGTGTGSSIGADEHSSAGDTDPDDEKP